jgi:fibro-slime domain-containing protein
MVFVEPCAVEGEERPCRGVWGEGVELCQDGVFGECLVPRVEERCDNACGSGIRACVDGDWGECDVPYVEEGCVNDCGSGFRECSDGEWSECQVEITMRECSSVCGSGHETCSDGSWGPCDAPQPRPPVLTAFVRDFRESHDDFEIPPYEIEPGPGGPERGIVEFELGPDDKPVYAHPGSRTRTTTGETNYNQWFRDVPGVNEPKELVLELAPSANFPGLFVYHDDDFFPIDDDIFGNEGNIHNYHFTLEARTSFEYRGGEIFSFMGDDDMWVFVNRRLAIDLGGLHVPYPDSVALDDIAFSHGLVVGNVYPLHFFFAERHTVQSTFNIETSIADPGSCD